MPLDHFSNSTQSFKNRFWVNSTYYKAGGPVFCELITNFLDRIVKLIVTVFDSGEQNAEPLLPYYLQGRSCDIHNNIHYTDF